MSVNVYTPKPINIIHKTKVDFYKRMISDEVNIVQYDSGIPIVEVKLYSNDKPYSIPDDDNIDVRVRWGKKDNTFVYKSVLGCNEDRNIIYFDIDEQMSYLSGKVEAILEIYYSVDETFNRAGSSPIPITVERNPVQESDMESQ